MCGKDALVRYRTTSISIVFFRLHNTKLDVKEQKVRNDAEVEINKQVCNK